jgi:ELWxxDGT repeat protein
MSAVPSRSAPAAVLAIVLHSLGQHLAVPVDAMGVQAPPAELVVDLDPREHVVGSSPRGFWPVGDKLYFEAAGALWLTDGTPGGTRPIHELARPIEGAVAGDGRLVFSRRASPYGITGGPVNQPLPAEVWATDGTPEGTELILDGLALAARVELESFDGGALVAAVGRPGHLPALWRADGTRQGTVQIAEFPGGVAPIGGPLSSTGAWVYFGAGSLEAPGEWLHRSDGTSPGTRLVFDQPLGGSARAGAAIVWSGEDLLFFAGNGDGGLRLWRTQPGSDTVQLVSDLAPGSGNTASYAVAGGGGRAYFMVQLDSPDPRCELWVSEGNTLGTRHLHSTDLEGASCPDRLVLVGDRVFFAAHGDLVSSGPLPGTVSVIDGGEVELTLHYDAVALEDHLVFVLFWFATRNYFVFSTDGTPGNFETLTTVPSSQFGTPPELGVFGDHLYLTGWDAEAGRELWRSDGTPAGTHRFADLVAETASSSPEQSRLWGNRVAFLAREPDGVRRAFATDGTAGGTEVVAHTPSSVEEIVGIAGGRLVIDDPVNGLHSRLYAASGTSDTELLLAEDECCTSRGRAELDDLLVFAGYTSALGKEPWVTDGRRGGTRALGDLAPGRFGVPPGSFANSSYPDLMTRVGDYVYFRASVEDSSSLWRTRGTPASTEPAAATGALPLDLTAVGTRLFFHAAVETAVERRTDLFVHDSVSGSVTRVEADGLDASRPVASASFRGRLAQVRFAAASAPRELWLSDGTSGGTYRATELPAVLTTPRVPIVAAFGGPMPSASGRLFFVADTPETGWELWTTDGTEAGTHLLRDIFPGPASSEPSDLRVIDGFLVFSAISPEEGRELWRSDGTEEGTVLLAAVEPGPRGSHPTDAVALDDRILVSATRSDTGRELFAVDRAALQRSCRADDATLCLHERFEVSVDWLAPETGAHGRATAVPFTTESGSFWFFDPDNVELVVKILDGTALTDHFWVYYGALSDVSYWITVVDAQTGITRTYHNPPGNLCGGGDVNALPPERGPDSGPEIREGGLAVPSPPAPVSSQVPPGEPCVAGGEVACLGEGRFQVEVRFRSPGAGAPRPAATLPGTDDTAYFWFFDAGNVELAVKVLDGAAVNGQSWVLYGALSDVEYTVRVTEISSGLVREYQNAQGSLCGRADVEAFPLP